MRTSIRLLTVVAFAMAIALGPMAGHAFAKETCKCTDGCKCGDACKCTASSKCTEKCSCDHSAKSTPPASVETPVSALATERMPRRVSVRDCKCVKKAASLPVLASVHYPSHHTGPNPFGPVASDDKTRVIARENTLHNRWP